MSYASRGFHLNSARIYDNCVSSEISFESYTKEYTFKKKTTTLQDKRPNNFIFKRKSRLCQLDLSSRKEAVEPWRKQSIKRQTKSLLQRQISAGPATKVNLLLCLSFFSFFVQETIRSDLITGQLLISTQMKNVKDQFSIVLET